MSERPLDQLDVDLQDDELLEEVELTAALMVAANQHDVLSRAEIDALLGLEPVAAEAGAHGGAPSRIA